jgi:hypothetical protein
MRQTDEIKTRDDRRDSRKRTLERRQERAFKIGARALDELGRFEHGGGRYL